MDTFLLPLTREQLDILSTTLSQTIRQLDERTVEDARLTSTQRRRIVKQAATLDAIHRECLKLPLTVRP